MRPVPTGRVKWYDAEKGFGFLSQEEGEDVYVRSSALPAGVEGLKAGQRVEFGMAAGRRGPQALSLKLIDPPPSLTRTRREAAAAEHKHTPDELHGMVEDMITLLEGAVQPELRKGRYPDRKVARRVSEVVGPSPANSTPKSARTRSKSTNIERYTFGGHAGGMAYVAGGGEFNRDTNYITTRITADGRDGYPGRAGPLPAGRRAGLPVGQPRDHRAAAARPGRRAVDGLLRARPTTSAAGPSTSTRAASTRC